MPVINRIHVKAQRWLWITITIFLVCFLMIGIFLVAQAYTYRYKIWPGVKVGSLDLGGKSVKQAEVLLQAEVDLLAQDGLKVVYQQKVYSLRPVVVLEENGQAYELWIYDVAKSARAAYAYGRKGGWLERWSRRLAAEIKGVKVIPFFKFNESKTGELLKAHFDKYEHPPQTADVEWTRSGYIIKPGKDGYVFDYNQAIVKINEALEEFNQDKPIGLKLRHVLPSLNKGEIAGRLQLLEERLNLTPIKIEIEPYNEAADKTVGKTKPLVWLITKKRLAEWLQIKKDKENNELYIGLRRRSVEKYLRQKAKKIERPAINAKFVVKNGRVIEWQSAQDGFKLDIDKTFNNLERIIRLNQKKAVKAFWKVERAKITNENVNNLGIKDLLGRGESDFSGSPRNRRHNIKIGADSLNGLLIKPDEEFSLLKALGKIDAESGYLPELVIKEGRTIPEYGGGLCQIGTTLFRAVINAGLPITQRRNHSYRVSYYEPAGTDATIYDPWPDFKFINDTGHYLLLQTKLKKNKAIFEFWGSSDGRSVSTTTPVIYNIVKPGAPEYIETTDLPPGTKKLVEHAHNGADAYFKREIVWPPAADKKPVEETWRSHYIPWKEKWLVGAKKATTTNDVIK